MSTPDVQKLQLESVTKFSLAALSTDGLTEKRQVLVNCSSGALDRQGDIVVQAGIETGSFLKTGGTVLWSHDPRTPIARCVSIGIDSGQLRALAQFPDAGISPKADEIYGLVKAGVINSVSIGFKPLEYEPLDSKDPWGGMRYDKVELMEFSFVSVPAQADATIIARSNHKRVGAAAWKCGASLNLPIGDDAGWWDDAVAEESIFEQADFTGDSPDTSFARKGFLAYDSGSAKQKDSYRLTFAKVVDGRLTAMPGGIRAAAARLSGADISDEARAKAQAVIDHYEAKMSDKSVSWQKIKAAFSSKADPEIIAAVKAWHDAQKSGRVMSEENMAHVAGMKKCMNDMRGYHTKALDSRGQTDADLQHFADTLTKCEGHCADLEKAGAVKPKPEEGDDDYVDPDDSDTDVELAAAAAHRKRLVDVAQLAAAP